MRPAGSGLSLWERKNQHHHHQNRLWRSRMVQATPVVVVVIQLMVHWWFLLRHPCHHPTTLVSYPSGHLCHPPRTICRGGCREEVGIDCSNATRPHDSEVR